MELVGKKFKLQPHWEDSTVYTISAFKDGEYIVSWMDSNEDEVEEQFTTYSEEVIRTVLDRNSWIFENE